MESSKFLPITYWIVTVYRKWPVRSEDVTAETFRFQNYPDAHEFYESKGTHGAAAVEIKSVDGYVSAEASEGFFVDEEIDDE